MNSEGAAAGALGSAESRALAGKQQPEKAEATTRMETHRGNFTAGFLFEEAGPHATGSTSRRAEMVIHPRDRGVPYSRACDPGPAPNSNVRQNNLSVSISQAISTGRRPEAFGPVSRPMAPGFAETVVLTPIFRLPGRHHCSDARAPRWSCCKPLRTTLCNHATSREYSVERSQCPVLDLEGRPRPGIDLKLLIRINMTPIGLLHQP